jgi:hypothetical protein
MKESLTFEDGIILCKYIYQNTIEKELNGVIEQEKIFYNAHEILKKINNNTIFNNQRLEELLFLLDIENIYEII